MTVRSWQGAVPREVLDAMWAGNTEWLDEHYRCICCCYEHTFEHCPARIWHGCRGSSTQPRNDDE